MMTNLSNKRNGRKINVLYPAGGSSNVFKNALNADCESMCTSSIIYTLYFPV